MPEPQDLDLPRRDSIDYSLVSKDYFAHLLQIELRKNSLSLWQN